MSEKMETFERSEHQKRLEREIVILRGIALPLLGLWLYAHIWNDPPAPLWLRVPCFLLFAGVALRMRQIAPQTRASRYDPLLSAEALARVRAIRLIMGWPIAIATLAGIAVLTLAPLRHWLPDNQHRHRFLAFLTQNYAALMWGALAMLLIAAIYLYGLARDELRIYRTVVPDLGRLRG